MAGSGQQAEAALRDTMTKYKGEYLMLVEGSVPMADGGVYCCIGGRTALDILKEAAAGAKARGLLGQLRQQWLCAERQAQSHPGHADPPDYFRRADHQGARLSADRRSDDRHHRAFAGVRPHSAARWPGPAQGVLFAARHDTCYRRPNYDAGLFVNSFDDENAKRGYCLYKMGCRGPVTYNACGVMRWNGGVSFPIQSGHGCIGCSEANFWDNGPFYQHLPTSRLRHRDDGGQGGRGGWRGDGGGHRGARDFHQHPQTA